MSSHTEMGLVYDYLDYTILIGAARPTLHEIVCNSAVILALVAAQLGQLW